MTRTRTAFARIALITTLLMGLTALAPSPASAATRSQRTMHRATNRSRVTHDIRRVDLHYRISKLVRKHSIAMAREDSIFHSSVSVIQNRYLDGVRWSTWGENVGVTGGTVRDLQTAFMQSPGHRANVLNSRFRRVAVGTYRDDAGLLWVTILFYG